MAVLKSLIGSISSWWHRGFSKAQILADLGFTFSSFMTFPLFVSDNPEHILDFLPKKCHLPSSLQERGSRFGVSGRILHYIFCALIAATTRAPPTTCFWPPFDTTITSSPVCMSILVPGCGVLQAPSSIFFNKISMLLVFLQGNHTQLPTLDKQA